MSANNSDALPAGSTLQNGRYTIESTIGEGGFGITYRATDKRLGRPVAIKEFYINGCQRSGNKLGHPSKYSLDTWQQKVTDFMREALTVARIKHPNIVTVFDCFNENETAYMVMEFVDGINLASLVATRGGKLPEAEALHYINEVGQALSFLHQTGILHRDVKPSNIMVDRQGHAVLIDFGAAREFVPDVTLTHTVILSAYFAPPEQYRPRAHRGPFTDIYALAATCYYLLTGKPPDISDEGKLEGQSGIRPMLLAALEHSMAFNPEDRPQSVVAFLNELNHSASAPTMQRPPQAYPQPSDKQQSPLPLVGYGQLPQSYPPPVYDQPLGDGQPPQYNPQPPYRAGQPLIHNARPAIRKQAKRATSTILVGALLLLLGSISAISFSLLNHISSTNTISQSAITPTASVATGNVTPTIAANPTNTTGTSGGVSTSGGGSSANGDMLKQAATSMKNAKSYHLDVSGTASGMSLTLSGDLDIANSNSSLTISAAGQNIQVITVGSNTYLSTDGGSTFTNAGSSGSSITSGMSQFTGMFNSFNSADVDKAASALKDASPSSDNIDGVDCHHITASLSDLSSLSPSGGTSLNGTADIWVATDGSRVCQIKETTTDKTTDITIKFSKLNQNFNIIAPSNVTGGVGGSGGLGGGLGSDSTPTTDTSGNSGSGSTTPIIVNKLNLASLDSIKSFHLSLTSIVSINISKIDGDFIRPDKAKMMIQSAGSTTTYIVIGQDYYISTDGITYIKSPSGGTSTIDSYTSVMTSTAASLNGYSGYKSMGSESIGGEDCTHYSYSSNSSGTATSVDIWVAKSDNTARQVKYISGSGTSQTEVDYTITKVNQINDSDIAPPPTQ